MSRSRRVLTAIPGVLAVVCFLVAVPAGLVWWAGYPLPRHLPPAGGWQAWLDRPVDTTLLVDVAACLIWAIWAVFLYVVAATIIAVFVHIRLPIPHAALLIRATVGSLTGIGIIASNTAAALPAAISITTPAHTATTPQPPATQLHRDRPVGAGATQVNGDDAPTFAAAGFDGQLTVQAGGRHYTVTVRRHDTLWDIAESWLGDANRWPQIYQLNRDRYDQHGRMHHGNLILPGWVLILPDDATPPRNAVHTPAPGRTHPPAPKSDGPTPTPTTPTPNPSGTGGAQSTPALPGAATAPPTLGVAPSPTPAPTGTPSPTPARPNSPTSASHLGPSPTLSAPAHTAARRGVDLDDRGWITLDVAAAITAAVALLWIQRRRRYRPGPLRRDRDDTDLAAMPRSIAAVHHARTNAEDDHMPPHPDRQEAATVTVACLGIHTDNTLLRLPDLPAHGVGLTGPGAVGAARGVLAAVLSAGGPWAADTEAAIITTTATLNALLPDTATPPPVLERLHIGDTIGDTLHELERHLLHRARLATTNADITEPDDDQTADLPPLVFLHTTPTGPYATRLAAILAVGSRLAITAILYGDWPHGDTWNVHQDGTTTNSDNHTGPRLNTLDPTTTADILSTLAQARPDTDDPPPAPPPPATPAAAPPIVAATTAATSASGGRDRPANRTQITQSAAAPSTPTTRPADTGRLQLCVLGRPSVQSITAQGPTELRIRRTDGIQILVNLAVNPHGATSDELMAALWPEIRPQHARRRFHTTISELRQQLHDTTHTEAIPRTADRYHLDRQHIHVDLWQLQDAIDNAATTLDPDTHHSALHTIIDLYHGPLADGHNWLWLHPHREQLRRHILDTHTSLADTAPDPPTALGHIQDAIRLDPYNEHIYQRAIYLHAKLNNPDGIRRTLRALSERLTELEVRISPQTQQIANDLTTRLTARQRATGSTG